MLETLIVGSVALNGLLAGVSLDQSIKQVRSRRRIGIPNYAIYVRGADLGTGLAWYIALPNLAVLTTLAAAVAASIKNGALSFSPIVIAATLSLAHTLTTLGAAPNLLKSRQVPLEDKARLGKLFDTFERWQILRATLQTATFACSIWALVNTYQ